MKVTIIGCYGGYPNPNGASSCYLLETEKVKVLLDVGSGALSKLPLHMEMKDLDGVVVSHFHGDHYADLECLKYNCLVETQIGKRKKPLFAYLPDYLGNTEDFSMPPYVDSFGYNENCVLNIGDLKVSFSLNVHPIKSFAIKVQSQNSTLVYSGDTGHYDGLVDFCKDADLLICECSLYQKQSGIIEGHLSSVEAGKLAKNANVKELILTHLPHYGNHEDLIMEAKTAYENKISLAKSGNCIILL